jgi:hypothetical protein
MTGDVYRFGDIAVPPTQPSPRLVYGLTIAAVIAVLAAAIPTFLMSDLLTGPAAMNGSARGTALIMTLAGAPVAILSLWFERRGSWRAPLISFGAFLYFAYNTFLLLTATPFNRLFLVYAAAMALTLLVLAARTVVADPLALAQRLPHLPLRAIAVFAWLVVAFNLYAWLAKIVPATVATVPTSYLEGTGLTTNPVFEQDMSFWLPFAAVIGWLLWTRRPWGVFLGGAWLVYGVLEGVGVATDQYLGASADPASTQVSMAIVPVFMVIAAVTAVPLWFYLRPAAGSPAVVGRRSQARPAQPG